MLPLWPVYYQEAPAAAFVLDAANRGALAQAALEFFELLGHPDLRVSLFSSSLFWVGCVSGWPCALTDCMQCNWSER